MSRSLLYFVAKVGAMEGVLLGCVLLLLSPGVGTLPQGGEPYSWRRPVPGWRQAEETVTLENKGFILRRLSLRPISAIKVSWLLFYCFQYVGK